jgi:hypothetical protein
MAETVTRQRPTTTTDGYGDTTVDWSAPTSVDLTVRGVEPVSSTENNDGRQAVITGFRVYLPTGADVLPGDRVVLRGATYEVDGEPADWRSPWNSNLGGVVVALKAVTG